MFESSECTCTPSSHSGYTVCGREESAPLYLKDFMALYKCCYSYYYCYPNGDACYGWL